MFYNGSFGKPRTKPELIKIAESFVGADIADFKSSDVAGGKLACAKVVTYILKNAGLIDFIDTNVDSTVKRLLSKGWEKTQNPSIGGLVVWGRTTEIPNKHIGIVTESNKAINNSSYELTPVVTSIFNESRPVDFFLVPPITKTNERYTTNPSNGNPNIANSLDQKNLPQRTKNKTDRGIIALGTPSSKKPNSSRIGCWQKINFPERKNKIICHASRISNHNLDFIATLDKENKGTWDVNVKSPKNSNGTYDKGICQFNSYWYGDYYLLPEWNNPEWQVNKCWEEFEAAIKRGTINTKFYAYPKREASKKNFIWVEGKY